MSRVELPRRRWQVGGLITTLLAAIVTVLAPQAHADAGLGAGDFVPLPSTPVILDTRSGVGASGERAANSTTPITVLGLGGIPANGVRGLLVRLTVINPTEATWAVAWPEGQAKPNLTMLSAVKGEEISNTVVVNVNDGRISLFNSAGKAHYVAEVQGYFRSSQAGSGGGFFPVAMTRVIDTRSGLGTAKQTIPAGGTRTVTLTGALVPAGAAAVLVNLLVPGASASGLLAAAPGTGTAKPIFNFEAGATQSSAALSLPADGKVTFTNKSSAAINLGVAVQGYFSKSSTEGAGMRQATNRLHNTRTVGAGAPIPANGTAEIQVSGTSGLPTKGISAAALNFIVTPEEGGWLKAWPSGAAEPPLTVIDFKADTWRDSMVVTKVGTNGRIKVRNGSDKPVHLIVDLLAWFADPVPFLPELKQTRVSAIQHTPITGASAGTMEYAFVDDGGLVYAGHQANPSSFSTVEWTPLPTSKGEWFLGDPGLIELKDGRVQIAVVSRSGSVWAITQTAAGAKTWTPWKNLGGTMSSAPEAGKLSDGNTVLFATDSDGKLWAYEQTGAVPFWRDLGDQDLTNSLRVVRVRDGLQIFATTATGAVKTRLYYNDGALSDWTDLGGQGLTGTPAVVVRTGNIAQVFVRGGDGTMVSKLQEFGGAWPVDWQEVVAEDGKIVSAGEPAAAIDPFLNRIVLAVRQSDNELYHWWQTQTGSNAWGPKWHTAGPGVLDPAYSDPTVIPFTMDPGGGNVLISYKLGPTNTNPIRFYNRGESS